MIKPYYEDKNCKIFNADCRDILPQLENVDFSFTSPPYNRKRNDKYSYFMDIENDWKELNQFVIENLIKITKHHIFYNIQQEVMIF